MLIPTSACSAPCLVVEQTRAPTIGLAAVAGCSTQDDNVDKTVDLPLRIVPAPALRSLAGFCKRLIA